MKGLAAMTLRPHASVLATLFAASIAVAQTAPDTKTKTTVTTTTTTAAPVGAPLDPREEAADAGRILNEFSVLPPISESRAVEGLLHKRVDFVDWTDKTFDDVMDWLREQGGG